MDYCHDATLRQFFCEVEKYLAGLHTSAFDASRAIEIVRRVAKNPRACADYDVRCEIINESLAAADAFIDRRTKDCAVYLAYMGVINHMGDFYRGADSSRDAAQRNLLVAVKTVKCKNSCGFFQDIKHRLMPPARFAVKQQKHR